MVIRICFEIQIWIVGTAQRAVPAIFDLDTPKSYFWK